MFLINQVLVIASVTILHRLPQFCFTRVILDSGDSRNGTIANLNRLMHRMVGIQSLLSIAKNDGFQSGLVSMVYKIFDKKSSGGAVKSKITPNQRPLDLASRPLTKELHRPIIRKFENQRNTNLLKTMFWVLIWQICN